VSATARLAREIKPSKGRTVAEWSLEGENPNNEPSTSSRQTSWAFFAGIKKTQFLLPSQQTETPHA
jgi:hypothetical protein